MKTTKHFLTLASLTAFVAVGGASFAADDADTNAPTAPATPAQAEAPPTQPTPAPVPPADQQQQQPQQDAVPATPPSALPAPAPVETSKISPAPLPGEGLRMNFRGVPLEQVLNYMSDAAGFIIHPKTDIHGKVDVWSNQPLTQDEAVELLKKVLNENGFTAVQEGTGGRILTIYKTEDVRRGETPVNLGNDPASIPKTTDIVTQIIPVRSLNAVQLPHDLAPLLPPDTTLTANESGNALLMTDTQSNVRRIAEIVKLLDSVSASINTLKVFPLKFADAKELVNVIKELFPNQDTSSNNRRGGRGGGGFPFGFGGGGGGGGSGTDTGNGHTPTARVSAVSDDHSNSLIVSAPAEYMDGIADLIDRLDSNVENETVVEVFRLKHADPTEMSDLLANLFPDDASKSQDSQGRTPFRFGGFGGFGGFGRGGNNTSSSTTSEREKRLGKVIAVPDRRTSSVIVSAATNLMPQIRLMITQLDNDASHAMKVKVYSLQNADVQDVQQVLQDLFANSTSSRNRNTTQNPLQNRQTTQLQQQNSSAASSFGSTTGGGNRGGFQ